MKTILSGIIALIFPVLIFAQNAKEAQDLTQVRQKINSVEKENQQLKRQLSGVQKTLSKINEAEIAEQAKFKKYDSIVKSGQDTVKSYSARILQNNTNIAEIEHALKLRTIGMIIILIVIALVILLLWWTHRAVHTRQQNELLDKMKAQRDEREQRISELKVLIATTENEFALFKKETGDKLATLGQNITQVDKGLQILVNDKSYSLETQIKEGFARHRKEYEEGAKNLTKRIEEVHSLIGTRINELGQKVVDSGKKLDDQISAAHKKADELKTVLAREIEAIRSKFE
jgi:predicted PurR-regulated permease PerM